MAVRSIGLDVVRAVCVAGVLVTHFAAFFLPADGVGGTVRQALAIGSFGVTGFFLLSAYLLTGILLKEVSSGQRHIWRRYWARRSLRIWPLYYLAVIVVILLALVTSTNASGIPWLATFTYNWTSWQEPNTLLSHFWSMCVEEQLYILVPILCFLAFRWRLPIMVALIVVAPLTRFWVAGAFPYPAVWNFTTSHLDVFAIGMLLASLDFSRGERWSRIRAIVATSWWATAVVALMAVVLVIATAIAPAWVFGSRASAVTYLAVAIIWAWALLRATRATWSGSSPVTKSLVWMGRRSYGIYVFHWPVVVGGLALASVLPVPPPVIGIVGLVGVLVLSELSFRYFESPFLRLKARFSGDPIQPTERARE